MLRRAVLTAAILTLGLTSAISEAMAQQYGGRGFSRGQRWGLRHRPHAYVGGQLSGLIVVSQVTDYINGYLGHGGGVGLFVGGRLSPYFSLEGNWLMTWHNNTYQELGGTTVVDLDALYLMGFTVDGKIHIPTRGPIEPFFQAGVGWSFVGATYSTGSGDSVFASGPMFEAGAGLDLWLGPWFSVGGRVLYRGYYFGEPSVDRGDTFANFVNGIGIDGNATFHF